MKLHVESPRHIIATPKKRSSRPITECASCGKKGRHYTLYGDPCCARCRREG